MGHQTFRSVAVAGAATASIWMATLAWGAPLASHPIAAAVRHSDCEAAINLVKSGVGSKDQQALFLGGRMLDEGICVVQNHAAAAEYFQIAAKLGDPEGSLEYAAKVGLGEGAEQSYERAGELCRAAGLDPRARLSSYSLGYVCTLRSVAARLLRVQLPAGAFKPGTGSTRVEFNPASSKMRVVSTPQVGRKAAPAVGRLIADPLVDAPRTIESAWRVAVDDVPKPDAARLEAQDIELSLDTETILENGPPSEDTKLQAHGAELPLATKLINFPMGRGG
jgi:hypothetical protein